MPDRNNSAEAAAKNATQLPESVQFALIKVLPNIINGAFWGFANIEECRDFAESLKGDKNVSLRKLAGGKDVLVEVNPDYLVKAVQLVAKDAITPADINEMQKGIAEGKAQFEKFLISKADKNYKEQVGIYCINDSTAITYKGVAHPAFRVDIRTALSLLAKWGYVVAIQGKAVPAQQAFNVGGALFGSMHMSPTNTGIFIGIMSTLNSGQIKQLKAQYGMSKQKAKQ